MSKDLAITAVEVSPEKLRVYDEICGAAFVNLFTLSKESETIAFRFFDPKDEEHLFLLGVAKGLAGSLGKKVSLDVNKFQLWKLNRGIDKDCRMIPLNKTEEDGAIHPDMVLDFMRAKAVEACGEDFTFADIYHQYYKRKKEK
jgi:hypothetical protein